MLTGKTPAPPEPRERLRKDQRELIAHQAAGGITTSELAKLHGLSRERVRRLLETEEMQVAVAENRTKLMQAPVEGMFRLLMYSEELFSAQLSEALDSSAPNSYKARVWCLDRIMPQRQAGTHDVTVNVAMQNEVAVSLTEAIKSLPTALNVGATPAPPPLIEGATALPSIDVDTMDPPPVRKPTYQTALKGNGVSAASETRQDSGTEE